MKKILIGLAFMSSFHSRAAAPAKNNIIAGVGVMVNQLDSRQPPQLQSDPVTGTQVGLLASGEYFFRTWFSVEVDAIFGDYQYVRQVGPQIVSETVTRVHVPILFKFNFLKYFSVSLGPYASYRMGEVKSLSNQNVQASDRSSANDIGEHGLEGGLGAIYPVSGTPYFIGMDYRQLYSLTPRTDEERIYRSFFIHFKKLL